MSISVVKSANKNLDIIDYSIVVKNTQNTIIYRVEITDCEPMCTTMIPNSLRLNGVIIPDNQLLMGIEIPTLLPEQSITVTFQVKIDPNCSLCSIENTASIKYILDSREYFQDSNTEIVKMPCNETCSPINNSYIIPGPGGATEVVIMTDEDLSGGIVALPGNTLSMTSDAIWLLYQAFIAGYPSKVSDLNPRNNYDVTSLLVALNDAGIISFTKNPPNQDDRIEYSVPVGGVINRPPTDCPCCTILEPILAQYRGRCICIKIGPIRVYIYFSVELLRDIDCNYSSQKGYNAISTKGEFGFSVYPRPVSGAIGSNCSSCGVCGVCGACGLCGPSVILGAASSALISVTAISSAIAAFPGSMGEN